MENVKVLVPLLMGHVKPEHVLLQLVHHIRQMIVVLHINLDVFQQEVVVSNLQLV